MNEQPSVIVGHLGALIFTLVLIYYIVKGYIEKSIVISDNFIIGHIIDNDAQVINCVVKQSIPKTKTSKTKIKKQVQKTQPSQLYLDCIEALVALGMKKTQAKQRANDVFNHTKINSIQEFLNIALKTQ